MGDDIGRSLTALETQLAILTGQVTSRTGQVAVLTRAVQTLVDDVEELKAPSLEAFYQLKGPAYFSRLLCCRRLTPDRYTRQTWWCVVGVRKTVLRFSSLSRSPGVLAPTMWNGRRSARSYYLALALRP